MERVTLFLGFIAIIIASSASTELPSSTGNDIDSKAFYYDFYSQYSQVFAKNKLVAKLECATDIFDNIALEHQGQPAWEDCQQKLLKSVSNLLLCLKYHGFQAQRYFISFQIFKSAFYLENKNIHFTLITASFLSDVLQRKSSLVVLSLTIT